MGADGLLALGREALLPVVLKDDDRPHAIVVGKKKAKCRDHEIEVAVTVEINGLDVCRGGDAGDRLLDPRPSR